MILKHAIILRNEWFLKYLWKEKKLFLNLKKKMREQLLKEFNLINLDDFEKYKLEILSPFLNTSSQGLELLDEE